MGIHTGLRLSEICNLTWGDVDLERGFIRVGQESKSHKPRYVPINSVVRAILEGHAPRFGPSGPVPQVFVNPRRRHAYRAKSVSHDFKKAVRKLAQEWKKKGRHSEAESLRQVSFHSTRHTFASWLIQRGVPPAEIQQYLGHSSDTMTRRYAHLAPAMARGNTLEILIARPNGVSVAKETCREKRDAVNSWAPTRAEIAQR
jgi:integrase